MEITIQKIGYEYPIVAGCYACDTLLTAGELGNDWETCPYCDEKEVYELPPSKEVHEPPKEE